MIFQFLKILNLFQILSSVCICIILNYYNRAICGRIENTLQGLPPPFLLNRPEMLKSTSIETRQAQKAPSFAVIWMKGMETPEIVSTERGKTDTDISLVCKQKLSHRFINLEGKISTISDEKIQLTSYADAKESVKTYVVSIVLFMLDNYPFYILFLAFNVRFRYDIN